MRNDLLLEVSLCAIQICQPTMRNEKFQPSQCASLKPLRVELTETAAHGLKIVG